MACLSTVIWDCGASDGSLYIIPKPHGSWYTVRESDT